MSANNNNNNNTNGIAAASQLHNYSNNTTPNGTSSTTHLSARPMQIETFTSFPVNQVQKFDILLATNLVKSADLICNIENPILGSLDKQIDWIQPNRCTVSFRALIVGLYTIDVELLNQTTPCRSQFQAKAYDLSKVFINDSSGKCYVNESYEFSVDASEAGEGQLEIAVNEGEIPNQVQVLDNGKCIVNFVPEEAVHHVVDIKFNGHDVNGCPFVVTVLPPASKDERQQQEQVEANDTDATDNTPVSSTMKQQQQVPTVPVQQDPSLSKEERILVNTPANFSLLNIRLDHFDQNDLLVVDPENQQIPYKLVEDSAHQRYDFEFTPTVVGDYTVELKQNSKLLDKLSQHLELLEQFPFPVKVFDFTKVLVSDVTDGIIGHAIYFFIDASQAGSGNLEIRVSSKTRNVPNYPQSEAHAKIRVNFTPTEAVDHLIDVKFNGIPVPGNPFLVKVAQFPQARLPVSSQDVLKYVAIDEFVSFYVDYIGTRENKNMPPEELTRKSCQAYVLRPDFVYTRIAQVELVKQQTPSNDKLVRWKIDFKPTKIGPYKLFITVNNELLPSSPVVSNVYNINEVKVYFEQQQQQQSKKNGDLSTSSSLDKAVGQVKKPFTFTVDASRAGEGTLALAVVSGISRSPVQTDVKVSDKGHGLYNLTFVPVELAPHSIDMSFNDRLVPESPFLVEILDENGKPPQDLKQEQFASKQQKLVQNFENLSLKRANGPSPLKGASNSSLHANGFSGKGAKKSIAFGLVDASNIVYLESGMLEMASSKSQVTLLGPNSEQVPFTIGKGSPHVGEAKKPYIEYKPRSIGTHTINVFDANQELHQYFVEICDPSLAKITNLNEHKQQAFMVGKPVTFCIDSSESGQIQIDSITVLGPNKKASKGSRSSVDQEQTILGRIKSISSSSSASSSSPSSAHQSCVPVEHSLTRLDEHRQEVRFVPQVAGKYSVDVRSLGQSVGVAPFELEVVQQPADQKQGADQHSSAMNKSNGTTSKSQNALNIKEDELLQNIVVHGISLKCSPVNSTGAFIIETNRLAQARDFDVLITDPNNSLVDVQCYLQQDGNLLAEWTPKRVGSHKIEVLYKDRQVPGSPFLTEAFDPSGVIIKDVKTTVYLVDDRIEFKIDRKEAGYGELDVAITSPVGQDLPIDIKPLEEQQAATQIGELISFTPTVPGKYKMSITFGGFEVPKSPITFIAREKGEQATKVSGAGLRGAEVNRSAQFMVESASEGELKLRIECGEREIVPKVERRANIHSVKYKPTEVGYASISVYWNGVHVEGSPFQVTVNDLSKILFLSGTNKSSNSNNQRIIDYEPKVPKEITVDTSKCGPGELKAEAYCRAKPNIKFTIPTQQYSNSRYKLTFVCPPKAEQLAKGISLKDISLEATYLIRFYYNNLFVPETLASVVVSPLYSQSSPAKQQQIQRAPAPAAPLTADSSRSSTMESNKITNNNNINNINNNSISSKAQQLVTSAHTLEARVEVDEVDCPVVALRGHGLVDAKCGEKAEFTIDGSKAGPGQPEVRFCGLAQSTPEEVQVRLEQIGEKLYKASYVAQKAGIYSLNVLWDGKQVAGCPVSVNVAGLCDASKVLCTGDGLKGGVLGEDLKTFIDTRRAGPGELTAICTGPQKVAFCELLDRGDGTFILYIKPQEPGRQFLTIKYGGQHIPKSPFLIKVSGKPDPSKVRVYGPGVEHGVLSLYQSRFVCDTRGAGAGQLTVRIRGPKGAFRMETQRESQRDRTILCKYDPTEPGDYRIEIKWSGRHVPGSPFSVMIFDTQEELNTFCYMTSNNRF